MIYSTPGSVNTYSSSLTFYPGGVEVVGPEPPPGQVLAGDSLLVLGVVTNTGVGEQVDWQHHHAWVQWVSSYSDQETINGWFPTYDGCNDQDGNEDPVPIPGCWGGSNKFLKQLLLHPRVGKWKSLFSLPVGRDTHIYFSSNLPRPPCALCDNNLIIFFMNSYFQWQGRGRGNENILMLFGPS